jgi:hypothetical protein
MTEKQRSTISIELEQPAERRLRDLWHLLATVNNIYNYYSILTIPTMRAEIERRVAQTKRKNPKALLYSSSLESIIGRKRRLHVATIQQQSPIVITLEGTTAVIAALTALLGLLTPFYSLLQAIKTGPLTREERRLELEKKRFELLKEQLNLLQQVQDLAMRDDLKEYILESFQRLFRSLELNPVKALLRLDPTNPPNRAAQAGGSAAA